MSTMAETNTRDMDTLRKLRSALSAVDELLTDAEHGEGRPMHDGLWNALDLAALKLRKEAEQIEAAWN